MNIIEILEDNVLCALQSYIGEGKTVIIGVSGGADSVALLNLIVNLSEKLKFKIIVAHVNHSLRGKESDMDEEFVKNLCKKYDIIFVSKKVDIKELQKKQKISLEDAGRQARYTFFYRIKEEYNADFILLAHHRDDNVETMLLNLIRGSGVRGLTGIAMGSKDVIRPLLDFSKKELMEYCAMKKLGFREDKTNKDTEIRRNYVRHKLIPAIEKINPNFREMFHFKSFYFEEIEHFLNLASFEFMKKYCSSGEKAIITPITPFKKLMPAVQRTVIQTIYELFHGSTQGLSGDQIEDLLRIIHKNTTGKEKMLGTRMSLIVAYGKAIFQKERGSEETPLPEKIMQLPIPGTLTYGGGSIITRFKKRLPKTRAKNKIYIVAKDKNEPFFIRRFQPGDRIRPFGMAGSKKLQDLFTDEKIPRSLRRQVPIVTDQGGNIVAVGSLRVDRGFHPQVLPGVIVEIEFDEGKE
ncbi:MAG: tRNA lysidine(34) synthetase TilS [Patescibacteria group bacterium]